MNRLFRRRDEQGVALITVIMLSMIATLFVTTTMYVAFHDQTSSAHNRSWGQALHVAESGVHEAIAYLQNSSGVVPSGTADRHHDGGHVPVPHRRPGAEPLPDRRGRHRRQRGRAAGQPPAARSRWRRPSRSEYALFSLSDVTAEEQLHRLRRRLRRYLLRRRQQRLGAGVDELRPVRRRHARHRQRHRGDRIHLAWATGPSIERRRVVGRIHLERHRDDNGGSIGGDAKASSSTPGCPDDPSQSQVQDRGRHHRRERHGVGQYLVDGGRHEDPQLCTAASEVRSMPSFTFNSANYPAVHRTTSYSFPTDHDGVQQLHRRQQEQPLRAPSTSPVRRPPRRSTSAA